MKQSLDLVTCQSSRYEIEPVQYYCIISHQLVWNVTKWLNHFRSISVPYYGRSTNHNSSCSWWISVLQNFSTLAIASHWNLKLLALKVQRNNDRLGCKSSPHTLAVAQSQSFEEVIKMLQFCCKTGWY